MHYAAILCSPATQVNLTISKAHQVPLFFSATRHCALKRPFSCTVPSFKLIYFPGIEYSDKAAVAVRDRKMEIERERERERRGGTQIKLIAYSIHMRATIQSTRLNVSAIKQPGKEKQRERGGGGGGGGGKVSTLNLSQEMNLRKIHHVIFKDRKSSREDNSQQRSSTGN